MNLYFEIKSRFQKATIVTMNTESTILEIVFEDAVDSVSVNSNEEIEGRFTISYPEIKKDFKGNIKLVNQTTHNILLTGVIWVLYQVEEHGRVMPEFMYGSERLRAKRLI